MNAWIISWLLLAISITSIFSDVASASASALCPGVDQRSLLLELRDSLVFYTSMSSKLVQWDQSADSWSGVMCEDSLVVGLDLSEEGISGGFNGSSSLFRLRSLQSLNLAFNEFYSAPIPSCLANLSLLVHLNLSYAGFGGRIPAELSRLTKLRTLDLSGLYTLDLDLPKLEKHSLRALIGNLGELRELYLDWVDFSAEGSEWCDALSSSSVPKLEVLSLSYCSLSGPINASLMSLANLSVIQLDGNNLSPTVPSFLANFSSLKKLSLSGCGLQGEFPREVFQIQTLQTLDVSFNKLLRGSLPNFQEDNSLETLVLILTNISGGIPDSIGNLKKLTTLVLSNCGLSGSIPSFAASRNLTEITLSNNAFTGHITSVGWEDLLNLEDLDLSGNSLEGDIPPSLFALPQLKSMSLSRNKFSGQLIICLNVSSYRLQWLDMGSNRLQGSIPTSIFKLQGLQHLDMGSNQLQGSIPASIFNLQGLQHLDMRSNQLQGSIPASIFKLQGLHYLDMGSNQLQGSIPASIFKLQGLQYLDLGSNQLQGSIPASIFKLQRLQYLSLSFNKFNGSMNIEWLQGFGNLTDLHLSYSGLSINAMTSVSPVASSFPVFVTLRLASCQLQMVPRFLANQSQLAVLDLSNNHIQGEIPQWMWTAQGLWYLNLSFNSFEGLGTLPSDLTSSLSIVDLHSNKLSGNMIPLLTSATYLDFSNNSFHGSILKLICEFAYGDNLIMLDFSHNHLNGTIPDCLMMASLKVLNLRNNQLSGDIPRNMPTPCELETLDISHNSLQGRIPFSLANCTMLKIVNIAENQIEGTFPCHLMGIASLRILVLRSNKLYGEIGCPRSCNTWQKLQIIDLSSNYFGGIIPMSLLTSWEAMKANVDFDHLQCDLGGFYYQDTVVVTFKNLQLELITILTIFTSIDLSNNQLDGPIPYIIGDLKSLYFLNLSHNAISGIIPSVLGNLHQLESLDLSRNYLNGAIPAQLANLDFLSVLNLSDNQLVGRIPNNGHFLTFSENSFEGNTGLCGFQLNKSCLVITNGTNEASDDDDNNDSEKKWFYMGIPLGFVVGFWAFCGPLVFIRSWKFAYYRFWDKVLFKHLRP